MGLDMYAFKTTEITPPINFPDPEDSILFHEWRKHPNLHGWMESLYYQKGGQEEFNTVNLQLTAKDIGDLKADIECDLLPKTDGFFFGKSNHEEIEDDHKFIAEALTAIDEGYHVYYSSWW